MHFGVLLARVICMLVSLNCVSMCDVRVVRSGFMVALVGVLGSLTMMFGGLFVVLGSQFVQFL
jgi:hypothetical protein